MVNDKDRTMVSMMLYPLQPAYHTVSALSIAGSDSSGGAGIQADLKTFEAHHVFGQTVITALTAQNTCGVYEVMSVSPQMVSAQIDAVFSDIRPQAVKIGMVASANLVEVIAERLLYHQAVNIVVDPVMVATSGASLAQDDAVQAIVQHLFPLASCITPNLTEASTLVGRSLESVAEMEQAAQALSAHTSGAVVIKGGHLIGERMVDVAYVPGEGMVHLCAQQLHNENTHGTGCTFSSAIAACLAQGYTLQEALDEAKRYVYHAIAAHLDIGKGRGPLDHAYQTRSLFDRKM